MLLILSELIYFDDEMLNRGESTGEKVCIAHASARELTFLLCGAFEGGALLRCRDQRAESFHRNAQSAAGEAVDVGGVYPNCLTPGIEHRTAAATVGRRRVVY